MDGPAATAAAENGCAGDEDASSLSPQVEEELARLRSRWGDEYETGWDLDAGFWAVRRDGRGRCLENRTAGGLSTMISADVDARPVRFGVAEP